MQRKILKNEKGSITLFILLAILFFLIVIFTLFVYSSNKNTIQNSEIDKIKREYQDSVNNINQIYYDTASKPEKPTSGEGVNFDMSYGVIEIEFLEGTSYNISQTPNHPVLKSDMTAITYNTNGSTNIVTNPNSSDWYSYVAGSGISDNKSSHWANAKVSANNIDSYFVWIPRYAYRIIYFDSPASKEQYKLGTLSEEVAVANGKIVGYSDSRGIVDTKGRTKTGVSEQTAIPIGKKRFKTHPVFDGDVNYGGWTDDNKTPVKLQGIWVAKYEASSVEGNSNNQNEDNVTTKNIKIQPGVQSWRYISIENMFTNAKKYNKSLNSHLIKNSEWGAVAYLTDSKYGRNGTEITINNNGTTFYTGGGSGTSYINNANQSSTGNIYGIYDLSGNTSEYVAGYYKNGDFSSANTTFTIGTSDAYSTVYNGTIENINYIYGDATYETSGWNNDYVRFLSQSKPFFVRGGVHYDDAVAGLYYLYSSGGFGSDGYGFRICLTVQ